MPSHIQRPDGDYSSTPNHIIYDTRFNSKPSGDKAKLLLIYMYAKPPNWSYHTSVIAKEMGISESTVDRAIATAKDLGWLVIETERTAIEFEGLTRWFTSSFWQVAIPKEAIDIYEALKDEWQDKKRSYSENTPKASKLMPQSRRDDALSNTDSYKTESTKDLNTLSSVDLKSSKEKSENPAKKEDENASRGLVYSLFRQVVSGVEDPDPDDALVAGMIIRDDLTHYLGKKAIGLFRQGLVDNLQELMTGDTNVKDIAISLRSKHVESRQAVFRGL